jgi:O-acetyl-ADP-ribose deacetylase (regulator of RNase III)
MTRIEEGDLTEGYDFIAHQVNCRGVMGAGVAGQIAERYPACKAAYQKFVRDFNPTVGWIHVWEGPYGVGIVNLFGQDEPGPNTDLTGLQIACESLVAYMVEEDIETVAMPWNIGCGIGKGDWTEVKATIEHVFDRPDRHLIWVKRDA